MTKTNPVWYTLLQSLALTLVPVLLAINTINTELFVVYQAGYLFAALLTFPLIFFTLRQREKHKK